MCLCKKTEDRQTALKSKEDSSSVRLYAQTGLCYNMDLLGMESEEAARVYRLYTGSGRFSDRHPFQ